MRDKIKGLIYILVASILAIYLVNDHYNSKPKVAKYKIFEQVNYGDKFFDWLYNVEEDTRTHAIIRISGANSYCTAFVINDTTAITAGHCLGITKEAIIIEIPKINERSAIKEDQLLTIITRLESTCGNNPLCLRELRRAEVMLDMELMAREKALDMKADTYTVTDINGLDTGIVATAYSKHKRRDFGFLEGDFKNFKKLYIREGWHVKKNDILRACGYFGGMLPPTCVDFKAVGSNTFMYAGESMFVPGLSGGPVIDHLGYVVGVAASADLDLSYIEPTLGMVNIGTKKTEEEELDDEVFEDDEEYYDEEE